MSTISSGGRRRVATAATAVLAIAGVTMIGVAVASQEEAPLLQRGTLAAPADE